MSRLVDADGNTMPRFPRVSGDEPGLVELVG